MKVKYLGISVPARGIMNLNKVEQDYNDMVKDFRPRSGNYESE